jgi:hypothetical protein
MRRFGNDAAAMWSRFVLENRMLRRCERCPVDMF